VGGGGAYKWVLSSVCVEVLLIVLPSPRFAFRFSLQDTAFVSLVFRSIPGCTGVAPCAARQ